ncbi:hypothetical protein [Nitratidesulfovibrio sp.]|uniref:hypothetical protein n=1 Tax=Nitratidesulfovibrio sp. TaxID=2802297 RepID=UPI0033408DFB
MPNSIPELEAQMAQLEEERRACEATVRRLCETERPDEGICFAQEIHQARQRKLQLEVQRELRRVRINRLRLDANSMF